MEFIFDENNMAEFMAASKQVDFMHPAIDEKAKELMGHLNSEIDKAKAAYYFVRNEIRHSWDCNSDKVTKTATEALLYGEGTCYSKAMLLAALLRHEGFPVGFCYQRIKLSTVSESEYFLHGLNVVFFHSLNKWFRLDARGGDNNNADFSLEAEKLTNPIRPELDEIDFPTVFARPLRTTVDALEISSTCQELMRYHLPTTL